MELKRVIEASPFLTKYKYLESVYNIHNLSTSIILEHYKSNIQILLNSSSHEKKFQDLKNEIIFLIFISLHYENISQQDASRLWSLICKSFLLKIFDYYLLAKYPDYKKYFFILGLGKIGVKDLNFTSDIDLIVFFDSKNSSYDIFDFNKDIKKLITDISNISPTYFHKIDLRLRPDLGNSFLITDIDNAVDYYSSVGRNWERLAFHRSQFIGGSVNLYSDFLFSISGFLYRRSLDFYAIDEIKSLFHQKQLSSNLDIKNSFGLIRSCENIIHFNQLLWSGKIVSLRENNIHKLFPIMANYEFLSKQELTTIKDAYYFYRKIENYLHVKQNIFNNKVLDNDDFLKLSSKNYYSLLIEKSKKIQIIFKKLFEVDTTYKELDLDTFNEKSISIIKRLIDKANNINNSESIKKDYLQTINSLVTLLSKNKNKDDLIIKFDYLINYYKSGVHLISLSKYNQHLFKEISFIFDQSPKLTKLLQRNNFLIESLVYFFNYGLTEFKLRKSTDNFDLDLKKIIQDIYESIFLLDYLFLSKKISTELFLSKRNRWIRKFIYNLFHLVKDSYLSNKNIFTDLKPILFGSLSIKEAIPSSDVDIFFIYENVQNSHLENIKIVRRFYSIVNQYVDKDFLFIDDRNKPFDKDSNQVIEIKNFFDFYQNTNEIFHKLSFQKIQILSNDLPYSKKFFRRKKTILSNFVQPNSEYIFKMINIKNPKNDSRDLFQIYKITYEIMRLGNKDFLLKDNLRELRGDLITSDLEGSPSKIDRNQYLDELVKYLS